MRIEGKPPNVDDIITDHGALAGLGDDDHAQYHNNARGDARYWPLSTDLATQAELDAHVDDLTDAHDASAISVLDAGGLFDAVNVEAALAEIVTNSGTVESALDAHLNDVTDAHDASAISVLDTGANLVATNVEAALAELADNAETLTALVGTKAPTASTVMDGDAAGGALAGTYPNPTFAVDMATQAELDAAIVSFGTAAGVAFTPVGTIAATNVQTAIAEAASEATQKTTQVIAGAGLSGGGALDQDRTLDVVVDGTTIAIAADTLGVPDQGITSAKIANNTIVNADVNVAAAIAYSKLNLAGAIQESDLAFAVISDTALQDHLDDTTSTHPAGSIDVADAGGNYVATNVETALAEVMDAVQAHEADGTDAHDASAISVLDAAAYFTATNVEEVLAELHTQIIAGGGNPPAANVTITDSGGYYTGGTVEAALQELGADIANGVAPSGAAGGVLDGTYPNPGLAAGVAGDGLSESANVLAVNVDGSTIELNADALRVKDAGVTNAKLATAAKTVALHFCFDGGGSAIVAGDKTPPMYVPFACTITKVTTLAEQSGSIVVDIWKDAYANNPPTVADTITASAKPTLSSADQAQDSTLTGWTTSISAGDILVAKVDSAATVQQVSVILEVVKT